MPVSGKLPSIVPANFSEKQFGVAENTGQWIVEFAAQNFAEIFVKAREPFINILITYDVDSRILKAEF
jgi:hypothetical protein